MHPLYYQINCKYELCVVSIALKTISKLLWHVFLQELGTHGKKGLYDGRIGSAISNIVQEHGGVMNIDDLRNHVSTFEDPISVSYKGYRVWEIPPNGQGMCALIALNLLESIDLKGKFI